MNPMPVPYVTVDISDTEALAMRKFFAYGAANGPNKSTPLSLEQYVDAMAAVCGRINIAQSDRDKAEQDKDAV